jgi:hypothetical protein
MFFRKLTTLALVMSLLSSCSWLRDKPKAQKGFETGELDLTCLRTMPTQLQALFAGQYTESEKDQASVKAIWTCLDRSLNTFSKYTHGSNSSYYTDKELLEFANRYLPEDNLFNTNLVTSIFKLKTAVLGGTDQNINQIEIVKLRKKLNRFGEIILPLAPYISTLLKPYQDLSESKGQIAGVRLNKFISDFAILLGDSENTVTWNVLSGFVGELEKYLKSPNPTALTVVREQVQVFQYLKILVVGGDENGIENTKWNPIFKSISAIYNALFMSTTTTEMMDLLVLEIQSNHLEQKEATEKLTQTLKLLKNDPNLYSKSTIQLLSDRWAKALILNAFLYPNSQSKLAIKPFLSSSLIRKITANLLDQLSQIKSGDQSVAIIGKMAENLSQLIEQAYFSNAFELTNQSTQLKKFVETFSKNKNAPSNIDQINNTITQLYNSIRNSIQKNTPLNMSEIGSITSQINNLLSVASKKPSTDLDQLNDLYLNTCLLIKQADPNNSNLNINDLRHFLSQLKPLFTNENDYKIIDSALDILQDVSSILIGKNSENISYKDLRYLLLKANDIYAAWKTENPVDFNKALATSLNVFIRQPSASVITIDQIQALLGKCQNLLTTMNFTTSIDWDQLNQMVIKGAKLKSVLFGNSNKKITNYELTQILNTWNVFTSKKDLDDVLESLAKFFRNNPYSSVKVDELMAAVDAFLPNDKKLSKLGLTPELAGSLKAFLVGGDNKILDDSEYSKIAQLGFTVYRNLKPILNTLPADFKFGLNSTSFAVFEAGLQGLIDGKDYTFSNDALKELLLSQLNGSGLTVHAKTIDSLLIGLNHRILGSNKGKKPKTYPASFSSSKLVGLKEFVSKTKLNFQDIENAFSGVSSTQSLTGKEIYSRLKRNDTRFILSSLHPIMNGKTSMPYFTSINGKPQVDYYQTDLNYKSLIYQALLWVFPSYEVEKDPTKKGPLPRLSFNDLVDLFDDVNDAVYEFGLSFSLGSAVDSAKTRMQSINLFTRTGNGDDYIDVIETTDFLTTTFAGKTLLDEVRRQLVKNCYPQNFSYKTQTGFSYECLKNEFFGKSQFTGFYGKVVPLMSEHFMKLNAQEQDDYRKSTLTAVHAGWEKESQLDLSDLETLVSIPYYIENIFLRLDHDYNGILNFTEAMSGFPIFCREIKKAGGDSIKGSCEAGEEPKQVEAIYGHLLMKGVAPRTIQPDDTIWEKAKVAKEFLLWLYTWNHLDRDPKVRDKTPPFLQRKDLLSIISNLSTSIAPAPAPAPLSVSDASAPELPYDEQFEQ